MSDFYQVVGINNRNSLVQSKRLAPYHEDLTKVQAFEPSAVNPGQYTKIKLDLKHATDREYILNDIRLRFTLDFSARPNVGMVFATRGTDLIRELVVKINEDVVFKVDKKLELSMLWEMNNHKTVGSPDKCHNSYLMNYGIIPQGRSPPWFAYKAADKNYYFFDQVGWFENNPAATGDQMVAAMADDPRINRNWLTQPTLERYDGRPRLIYDDSTSPSYQFTFDISLNQLAGAIFHRLHLRRIEFIQLELMFEPWISLAETQNHLLFKNNPVINNGVAAVHPYSVVRFTNLEIRQYRTTVLDGINGFTLPDNRMLSWLMHRYSRREFTFDFSTQTQIDVQLHDWEIRTNITRLWWMLAPESTDNSSNLYRPFGDPVEGYDSLFGVEILWKNDKVLDLATTFDVYRHYIMSENKRHGYEDPFVRFARLEPVVTNADQYATEQDGKNKHYFWSRDTTVGDSRMKVGHLWYEFPIYHVDFNMNVQAGSPGSEIIGGIVNDTSDYIVRLKRVSDRTFTHTGSRTLWVWIEYDTLVNLAANSNQFQRGSQIVTKQLNLQ